MHPRACMRALLCVRQGGALRMHCGSGRVNLCPSAFWWRVARRGCYFTRWGFSVSSSVFGFFANTFIGCIRVVSFGRDGCHWVEGRRFSKSASRTITHGSPPISDEMSGYQGKKNIPRITVSTKIYVNDGLKILALWIKHSRNRSWNDSAFQRKTLLFPFYKVLDTEAIKRPAFRLCVFSVALLCQ